MREMRFLSSLAKELELDEADEIDQPGADGFVVYSEKVRDSFDDRSQRLLDQLHARFHRVEVNDIGPKKWCVRVVREEDVTEPLALAAIGKTPHQAAERLWRISTFFD